MKFTAEQDMFLQENLDKCHTLYDLTDVFNRTFPHHETTYGNIQKRLQKLGLKKGTHKVRREKLPHGYSYETVIPGKNGHSSRVKTANGYQAANKYFREKYYGKGAKGMLINLNGDKTDFATENVVLVPKSEYISLCWRGWFFQDRELMKVAILTVRLLAYFPELVHNENQCYRMLRGDAE